jgi:hypothetical protein
MVALAIIEKNESSVKIFGNIARVNFQVHQSILLCAIKISLFFKAF